MGLRTPILYNFHNYQPPDPIPELLSLLGMSWSYDRRRQQHVIEDLENQYLWDFMYFNGGTVEEWTDFIAKIKDKRP